MLVQVSVHRLFYILDQQVAKEIRTILNWHHLVLTVTMSLSEIIFVVVFVTAKDLLHHVDSLLDKLALRRDVRVSCVVSERNVQNLWMQINLDKVGVDGDLSNYIPNNEWTLIRLHAERNLRHYSCCAEPYPDITYTIQVCSLRSTVLYKQKN